MDLSQMQKMSEQMQKAAESGDLGKVMETMSQAMGNNGSRPGMAESCLNRASASSSGT